MNNDELQQLTEMIAMNFFGKHFKHQIYFNSRLRSTGGRYLLETHNLEINPKQLESFGEQAITDIIKHELCHYHLHQEGKGYRHQDRDFKMLLQQVGGHRFVERMEPFRYIYSCKSCGATFHRMRKIDTNKFRCGRCRGNLVLDSTSES